MIPSIFSVLEVCKSFNKDILGFQKYFGSVLAAINNCNEENWGLIKQQILNSSEYDEEFTTLIKNVNNPMIVFAKCLLDQIDEPDHKKLLCGLKLALSYRYDSDDKYEQEVVDLLWLKMFLVSKELGDISIAFTWAISISNDKRREATLGGLFEELILNNNLSSLFRCRLSEKNFNISINYLKDKIIDLINKMQVKDFDDHDNFVRMCTNLLKFIRSTHCLYSFYSKPRESCQFLLSLYFLLEVEIETSQRTMLARDDKEEYSDFTLWLLEIEQQILSLLTSSTRSFENPEKYSLYIKENDIYSITKRKTMRDMSDFEMEDSSITSEISSRVFAKNTDKGKYAISLFDLEAYSAKNDAQLELYDLSKIYVCDISDIIDFCCVFKLYETAIHVCMTHNRNPESTIQSMALDYCELYNQSPADEDNADGNGNEYQFDEVEYAWQVDPKDKLRSQTDVLFDKIWNTLTDLEEEYPHLKFKAFEIIKANIPDINKIEKVWTVFDNHNELIHEIMG